LNARADVAADLRTADLMPDGFVLAMGSFSRMTCRRPPSGLLLVETLHEHGNLYVPDTHHEAPRLWAGLVVAERSRRAERAMTVAETSAETVVEPAYARFTPRLRALVIDFVLMSAVMVIALFAAIASGAENIARVLGFTVMAVWLLYEPLLVWLNGGTLGHYRCNLRVVDNRTQGNVGLLKAVARMIIKSALGWLSFVTMLTTRRSQAVHDLLTQSTVQIRDRAKASPHQFISERLELASDTMPSRVRRIAVILIYMLLWCVLVFMGAVVLVWAGLVSDACTLAGRCSRFEDLLSAALGLAWVAICIVWIALGWRGRLPGARRAT
jgi:uncharacterized RDD family membrane protein YckC